jgi:hypothetical protein
MDGAVLMPLRVFRNDPKPIAIVVTGLDLTSATFDLTVRQYPDQPGSALFSISTTPSAGAQGIRFIESELDEDGIPTSYLEAIINKSTIQALPVASEPGEDVELYYDFQVTPAADAETIWTDNIEQTWLYGPFIIKGSANA